MYNMTDFGRVSESNYAEATQEFDYLTLPQCRRGGLTYRVHRCVKGSACAHW